MLQRRNNAMGRNGCKLCVSRLPMPKEMAPFFLKLFLDDINDAVSAVDHGGGSLLPASTQRLPCRSARHKHKSSRPRIASKNKPTHGPVVIFPFVNQSTSIEGVAQRCRREKLAEKAHPFDHAQERTPKNARTPPRMQNRKKKKRERKKSTGYRTRS
jgi:hypothetical protein